MKLQEVLGGKIVKSGLITIVTTHQGLYQHPFHVHSEYLPLAFGSLRLKRQPKTSEVDMVRVVWAMQCLRVNHRCHLQVLGVATWKLTSLPLMEAGLFHVGLVICFGTKTISAKIVISQQPHSWWPFPTNVSVQLRIQAGSYEFFTV